MTIRFPGKGLFARGFTTASSKGRGFFGSDEEVKDGASRKVLIEGAEGQFTCVGREFGRAVSRFELADDFRIGFRLRIPSMPALAQFTIVMNQLGAKDFVQISFFQDVTVVDGGKKRRKVTENRTYAAPPMKWFDQKSTGVPFEIVYKDKKLTVTMVRKVGEKEKKDEPVELLTLGDLASPSAGKVAFEFRNVSFLMTDLVVEGLYHKAWAEGEINKLRKAGKLKVKPPEAVAKEEPKQTGKESGKETGAAPPESPAAPVLPPKRQLGSTDVKEPDPESGEEL